MAKLLLKFRNKVLHEIPVGEKSLEIGRTDDNDIVIKNLGVSRKHARVSKEGNGFVLEDLASRNGTILNHNIIERSALMDRDEIIIGKHTLVFCQYENVDESQLPSSGKYFDCLLPPDETMSISKLKTRRLTRRYHLERQKAVHKQAKKGGIKILQGGVKQSIVEFQRLLIVAGKGATADIRIKGDYSKDVVFIISNRAGGYFLSPPKGGISLTLNGQSVVEYSKLKNKDVIEAADTKMEFFIKAD